MHLKSPPPSPIIKYTFGLNSILKPARTLFGGSFSGSPVSSLQVFLFPSLRFSSLVVLFSFAFSLFSVNYAQIKIKEKVEIKPSEKIINNATLNKNLDTHFLEYELIWNGAPCASGGIQFRYSWLVSQQSTCAGSYRVGADITEQGIYYFIWSFQNSPDNDETHGTGTANIYLDGLLYESITISSGTGGNTSTLISFPQCGDDAPECDGEPKAPEIITQKVTPEEWLCWEEDSACPDYDPTKLRGYFWPLISKPFEKVELETCYDLNNDKWNFKIGNDNKIKVPYNFEICYNNLDLFNYKLILDISDINDPEIIPDGDECCAFIGFDEQMGYGGGEDGQYYILEALIAHEGFHKSDFEEVVENTNNNFNFSDQFLEYQPSCDEVSNQAEAQQKGEEHYNNTLKKYQKELAKAWDARISVDDNPCDLSDEEKVYEKKTQERVWEIIGRYIDALQTRFPNHGFYDTDYCKKSKWKDFCGEEE